MNIEIFGTEFNDNLVGNLLWLVAVATMNSESYQISILLASSAILRSMILQLV
jgi:hypothetical protein